MKNFSEFCKFFDISQCFENKNIVQKTEFDEISEVIYWEEKW